MPKPGTDNQISPTLVLYNFLQVKVLAVSAVLCLLLAYGLVPSFIELPAPGPLGVLLSLMTYSYYFVLKKLENPLKLLSDASFFLTLFNNLLHMGHAFINLILLGTAIFDLRTDLWWLFLINIPAFVHLINMNELERLKLQQKVKAEGVEEEVTLGEVYAEVTNPDNSRLLSRIKAAMSSSFLYVVILMCSMAIGFLYYYYLQAAIIYGNIWSLERIVSVTTEVGINSLPFIGVMIIVLCSGAALEQLLGAYKNWRNKSQNIGFDRELSDHEVKLATHLMNVLEEYITKNPYSKSATCAYWFISLGFYIWLLAVSSFVFIVDGFGASLFEHSRVVNLDWYIYYDGIGAGDFLIGVGLVFGYYALFSNLLKNWQDYVEYRTLQQKKDNYNEFEELGDLRKDIVNDIRKRKIISKTGFDPGSYIRSKAKHTGSWTLIPTFIIFSAAAYFWNHDRHHYHILTPERILYSEYWSQEEMIAPYSHVQGIELRCSNDNDGDLIVKYNLVLRNGKVIELIAKQGLLEELLARWEIVDAILNALNTPRINGYYSQSEESRADMVNIKQCFDGLKASHDKDTAQRIANLLLQESR